MEVYNSSVLRASSITKNWVHCSHTVTPSPYLLCTKEMSWDLSCLQVNQHQPFFIKAKFCQKENSKFNIKKLSAIGGFEPPQVREKVVKTAWFYLFIVCSQKYRYLVLSQICLNLPNDDIKKILHLLLWMIATSATNGNSLKTHWSAPIPIYTLVLSPFRVRPPL